MHGRFHLPRSVKSPAPIAQAAASADLCFVRGSWSCRVFRGRHVPVLITGCLFISMETLPQLTLLLSAKLPSQRGGTGRAAAATPCDGKRARAPQPVGCCRLGQAVRREETSFATYAGRRDVNWCLGTEKETVTEARRQKRKDVIISITKEKWKPIGVINQFPLLG